MIVQGPLSELLLDGRYRVGELIGSGGFGHVYAAMHVGLVAKVAIKVPRVDDVPTRAIPEAIAKFMEEGRTLKRLRHPNLAAALDVALLPPDADGLSLPYLVLEWCEGTTLKEWRATRPGWMPPAEVWSVLRPAFEAIAHAHDEGVAHRDIKPANILIEMSRTGEPIPRVIDFGIAKILGEMEEIASGATRTTSANRSFTPKYAAPEQMLGLRTGPWTDVYALALVLLEMVMGRQVFPSDEDARRAVVEADPPTPRKLGLDLGPWNHALERALAPRPADRPPHARALIEALDIGLGWPASAGSAASFAPSAHPPQRTSLPVALPSTGRGDDSGIPASHTMRTSSTGATRPAPRGRIWLIAGVAAAALGALVAITAWRGGLLRGPAPPTSASFEAPPPAAPPPSRRALGSLSADEVAARATAGGMEACMRVVGGSNVMVTCANGYVHLIDKSGGGMPIDLALMRVNQRHEAALAAKGYGAARFTSDGGWTLMVTTRNSVADDVIQRIVEGVRHEEIGSDKTPLQTVPVPARLAQWTGAELVQRIIAAGATPTYEAPNGSGKMVMFIVGAEGATVQLFEGDPDKWIGAMKGGLPFSYAVDETRLLTCSAQNALCSIDFVKKILGDAKAARFGRSDAGRP